MSSVEAVYFIPNRIFDRTNYIILIIIENGKMNDTLALIRNDICSIVLLCRFDITYSEVSMIQSINVIQAYQLAVFTLETSLDQIQKWECDTEKLEELLRINHRGWELFLKTAQFSFSNQTFSENHYITRLLPTLKLTYAGQNLDRLFNNELFISYFSLLDALFADMDSRYNRLNDLLGKQSKYYTVDAWIIEQNIHHKNDINQATRKRILEINDISLRCFFMNMTSVPELKQYSVVLLKWSSYYHDWFSKDNHDLIST